MAALGLISVSGFQLRGTSACVTSRSFKRTQQRVPGGWSLSSRSQATQISRKQAMQSHSTAVDTAEAEGDAGALLSTARAGLTWLNVRCNIAEIMELELKVDGMTCSACSSRVTEALKEMNGVDKVDVNLETGIATIEVHANDPIEAFNSMPRLVDKIGQLGFKAQAHFEDWM
ncbi:hypothetical protein ABBQ38_014304 [Trebouxia sp. C0009 RCD-2024]